jgi:membrane-associated phospholipid phosphatase
MLRNAALARRPATTDAVPRTLAVRGINAFVLSRVSHGFNTFPSGHVAVSIAAALGTLAVLPAAGEVMLAIAACIAVGAAAGRYHYAVDVLLGIVIGAAATLIA